MLSIYFFVSQTAVGGTKTVTVFLPSEVKNERPMDCKLRVKDDAQLEKFLKSNGRGWLTIVNDTISSDAVVVQTYDDLVDGSTYYFCNGHYNAVRNSQTRAQVEDKVLEEQVSLAMVNDLGKGAHGKGAHVHRNVKLVDEKTKQDIAELDRVVVVHEGGEDVPDSVAYVIECALSPQVKDVKLLLDKMEVFRLHTNSSSHFRSVGKIVPVLAGKMWSEEVIQECKAKSATRVSGGMDPILRIQPSGKDYEVIH